MVGSHCGFEGLYFSADPLIWHGPCTWKLEEAGKQQLTTPELAVAVPLAREMKEGLPPRLGAQIRPSWGVGSRCNGDVMTPRRVGCPLPSPVLLRRCFGVTVDASHVRASRVPFLAGRDVAQRRCTTEGSRPAAHPLFLRGGWP